MSEALRWAQENTHIAAINHGNAVLALRAALEAMHEPRRGRRPGPAGGAEDCDAKATGGPSGVDTRAAVRPGRA